jgi:pyridoxamine 5'-phosphate oxidase-like protein
MDQDHYVLSASQCWELLATVSVGRIALSVRALPVILPVQFYLDARRLSVCIGHRELPERSLNQAVVAFAADSIDPATRSGWSVQVQGVTELSSGRGLDTACGVPTAGQIVEIVPATIDGFRVHLCPFVDALVAAGKPPPQL